MPILLANKEAGSCVRSRSLVAQNLLFLSSFPKIHHTSSQVQSGQTLLDPNQVMPVRRWTKTQTNQVHLQCRERERAEFDFFPCLTPQYSSAPISIWRDYSSPYSCPKFHPNSKEASLKCNSHTHRVTLSTFFLLTLQFSLAWEFQTICPERKGKSGNPLSTIPLNWNIVENFRWNDKTCQNLFLTREID